MRISTRIGPKERAKLRTFVLASTSFQGLGSPDIVTTPALTSKKQRGSWIQLTAVSRFIKVVPQDPFPATPGHKGLDRSPANLETLTSEVQRPSLATNDPASNLSSGVNDLSARLSKSKPLVDSSPLLPTSKSFTLTTETVSKHRPFSYYPKPLVQHFCFSDHYPSSTSTLRHTGKWLYPSRQTVLLCHLR